MGKKSRAKREKRLNAPIASTPNKTAQSPLDYLVPNLPGEKPSFWRKGWKLFWTGLTGSATLLGLVTSILYFLPEVSVEPLPDSYSKDRPLDSIFALTNKGSLSLKQVTANCRINELKMQDSVNIRGLETSTDVLAIPSLQSKDRTSMQCHPDMPGKKVIYADITFFVSYKVAFWMFRQTTPFRFKTLKTNGKFMWIPEYTPDNTPLAEAPVFPPKGHQDGKPEQ